MYYQTFDEHPLFLHRMPQGRIYIPWYSDYLPPSTWLYFEKKRLYLTLLTVEGKFYTNFNLVSCQSFLVTYALLTHYSQVLLFDTPWKHQKNFRFSDVFRGYRKATPGCNRLRWFVGSRYGKKTFCQNNDKFGYSLIKNDIMFMYLLCIYKFPLS